MDEYSDSLILVDELTEILTKNGVIMTIEKMDAKTERFFCPLEHDVIPEVDPMTLEIISNRLRCISNEIGAAVHSAAHTPVFAETKDYSCVLFDHEGHLVAMGEFLPCHQGGMQSTMNGVIKEVGLETFKEGDVVMTNDAFFGACHPPDLNLFEGIYHNHEFIGIVGILVHYIDMGGMSPSSYCPTATELYQEGIRFPPTTKLYEGGRLREDILNILLTNIRVPEAEHGDLMAQVAGLNVGKRGVCELAQKYGAKMLKDVYIALQYYSKGLVEKAIEGWRDGEYEAEDYIDGEGVSDDDYKIKIKMTVKGNQMIVDFRGSDKQARGFINSQWGNTSASVYAPVMCHVDPAIPKNYGCFVPITLIAEKGTVVNPHPTAAISACTTEPGYQITNVMTACIAQAAPEIGSAVWGGGFLAHLLWGTHPKTNKYFVTILESGAGMGGGARYTLDGWPVAALRSANLTVPNIEVEESVYPILYKYRKLADDDKHSGSGQGRTRGGPGIAYEFGPLGDSTVYSTTITSKYRHPAMGIFGGKNGHLALVEKRDAATGEGKMRLPSKILGVAIEPGETLSCVVAGGAGYGPPIERGAEKVLEDVLDDFVSLESARTIYGVVINQETMQIDYEETKKCRGGMSS